MRAEKGGQYLRYLFGSTSIAGAILPLDLVQRWVPFRTGRRVPIWLAVVSASLVAILAKVAHCVIKVAATLHRLVSPCSGGRLGGDFRGGPILLLTTTGRRTGRGRTWPLSSLALGDDLVLVGSAAGCPRHRPGT